MKPTLQLKLSQQLKLTPQLQQSIRLLQLSTIELNQEIERIVQENPLLELRDAWDSEGGDDAFADGYTDDFSVTDNSPEPSIESKDETVADENFSADSDWLSNESFADNSANDDDRELQIPDKPVSLREHLNFQLCLCQLSEREKKIVSLLIDTLDEDGYLSQNLDELLGMLPGELGIGMADLENALHCLQRFDPPGVGARNLKECLILQLQAMSDEVSGRDQAVIVVQECLEMLASRDFAQIKKRLACDDERLRVIQKLVAHLNPKPGTQFEHQSGRYIVPEVTVSKRNGVWRVKLNENAFPRLNINRLYANILQQDRQSARSLADQLSEAKWLIRNVQQRSATILRVSSAIVERQQQFFEHGEVAMRPLVLREIADSLNLHESTVSRVTTQKFMYTPRGIFELKYFFGSHVATDTGGACSATAIRALIKQLIQEENPKKPLSDNNISDILQQQGIVVARRTIAKYREALQIPAASLRKSF